MNVQPKQLLLEQYQSIDLRKKVFSLTHGTMNRDRQLREIRIQWLVCNPPAEDIVSRNSGVGQIMIKFINHSWRSHAITLCKDDRCEVVGWFVRGLDQKLFISLVVLTIKKKTPYICRCCCPRLSNGSGLELFPSITGDGDSRINPLFWPLHLIKITELVRRIQNYALEASETQERKKSKRNVLIAIR